MFNCTSLILPIDAPIKRRSVRPIEFQAAGFDDEFDALTFFYDVLVVDRGRAKDLVLLGPPLMELFPIFCRAKIGGHPVASVMSNYYLRDRCCDIWVSNWKQNAVDLEFDFGTYRLAPQAAAHHLYAGKRVLYTLSKNNEIEWILDWVRFHACNHGANAVLIYDNASTKYSSERLERSLRTVFHTFEINVVNWPFKYGPEGLSKDSGWDSDFCQAGALQDARFRFLQTSASVLNCDVDELVLSSSGESIFEVTERAESGYTVFRGKWISNATAARLSIPKGFSPFRHGHFRYLEREPNVCPPKWCVVPSRCSMEDQWGTHSVRNKDLAACSSPAFAYRHFRSISTNWKYQRYQPILPDPKLDKFDVALNRALARSERSKAKRTRGGLVATVIRRIARPAKKKHVTQRRLAVDRNDLSLGGNMLGGDPNTYHPELWSFLVERFPIRTILDVGCGEGHCVKYCSTLGVRVSGIDGLRANVEHAVVPIVFHDLRVAPFILPVDLVLCCEVVEHLEEKYLPNLLQTLANGKVIAMTHALPGQTGYHHVNCRTSGYWIEKLEAFGYRFLPQETAEGKKRIRSGGNWTYFIQSGLIFERV
jgi:2-polyprenyl-3-methyl-5-hydroxy-6-metoxy-1,4-benzoquinol methylase